MPSLTARELRSRYSRGYIAIPAQRGVACPRCGASNPTSDDNVVKLVTDAHGSHLACRACGETWNYRASVKEGQ